MERRNSILSNLDYIRAHQYLYYVECAPVLSDYSFDMFGRDSGEDYKGGSDRVEDYTLQQKSLVHEIRAHRIAPLPV